MKKSILFLLLTIISSPCSAQESDDLTPAQQALHDQEIKSIVQYNDKINFINDNYDTNSINNMITTDQALQEKAARREGQAPTPKLNINPKDPNQVKIYLEYRNPNSD